MAESLFSRDGIELTAGDGRLCIAGAPDFDHAADLRNEGVEYLKTLEQGSRLTLDAEGVTNASSATLSVLLEWLRTANAASLEVAGVMLSPTLRGLATVTALDEVFDSV
ncbi:STAS domain-containing protein [Larsenimonas rhizosphaerae]|uniref:STAS domain-containing protein n=1 Tax=Larsenimonas rhizosphaerae TaxID=2944682 RepID=A0AA42CXE0_9GAMM|nr:STAS domain-containing protein [Larsenimonas rhizosphaerae]MCX2523775.1 STAS domain-containing protein [Larsenimonas rhizosphaerae]